MSENRSVDKICMVTSGYIPVPAIKGGAIEQLVQLLIDKNESDRLFDFTVITCDIEDESVHKRYCSTKFIYIKHSKYSKIIKKIRRGLKKIIKYDCWMLDRYNRMVSDYLKKNGAEFKYIVDEGCVDFQVFKSVAKICGREKIVIHLHAEIFSNPLIERVFGNALAISKFVEKGFKDSLHSNIKVALLYNAVDLSRFQKHITSEEKRQIRLSLGLTNDDFVVIYCGRLIPEKGVKELVEAVINLKQSDIKLVIVGSSAFQGAVLTDFQKELQVIAQDKRIIFTGFVDNRELYKYHQMADVGAVPSVWGEGFCVSLVEMMASGLPTIVTRRGGLVEVGTEETSMFIEWEHNLADNIQEGILSLYGNSHRLESMAGKSRQRALVFDGQNYLENYRGALILLDNMKS